MTAPHDEVGRAGLEVRVALIEFVEPNGDGALDVGGIATDLGTPVIEDGVFVGVCFGRAKAVPDVGMLRGQFEGDLLAAATYQNGDVADGLGNFALPEFAEFGQVLAERAQPIAGGPEFVPVFGIVAFEPA